MRLAKSAHSNPAQAYALSFPIHAISAVRYWIRANRLPCSEEGVANADHSRALRDGPREVAAHAHRKLTEFGQIHALAQSVAQFAQLGKGASRLCFPCIQTTNGHQPAQAQSGEICLKNHFDQWDKIGWRDAVLVGILVNVYLDQRVACDARDLRRIVQPAGELEPVDRMDPLKCCGNNARLVGLKMPDKMPFEGRNCRRQDMQRGLLVERFLYPILAEYDLARVDGRHHRFGWMRLGDRDQANLATVSAGAACSLVDLLVYRCQPTGHIVHRVSLMLG